MGDVAASGGYYISAQCNKIIAQANTITGSIGVIGLLFGWKKLCNKYGITFDGVNTNTYADAGNPNRDMSDFEKRKIQNSVNEIYSDFVKIVQTGRGFADSAAVDSIGQGRVWTGKQALKINLVDKIGGLSDAIALAAQTANLKPDDYSIIELPKVKSTVEKLIENLSESTRIQLTRTLTPFLNSEQLQALQIISRFNDPNGIYMQLIPIPTIN
jgi:protease-4